ncbi:MAG: hypothetical protein KDD04_05890, partial [Sinomicrobium sp.]|nr:hypothetical protein [Sinomicrobium sp.]
MGAVLLWCVAILKGAEFPKWKGYYGILLVISGIVLFAVDFEMLSVAGFRVIVFGLVSWIVTAGYLMLRSGSRK